MKPRTDPFSLKKKGDLIRKQRRAQICVEWFLRIVWVLLGTMVLYVFMWLWAITP